MFNGSPRRVLHMIARWMNTPESVTANGQVREVRCSRCEESLSRGCCRGILCHRFGVKRKGRITNTAKKSTYLWLYNQRMSYVCVKVELGSVSYPQNIASASVDPTDNYG